MGWRRGRPWGWGWGRGGRRPAAAGLGLGEIGGIRGWVGGKGLGLGLLPSRCLGLVDSQFGLNEIFRTARERHPVKYFGSMAGRWGLVRVDRIVCLLGLGCHRLIGQSPPLTDRILIPPWQRTDNYLIISKKCSNLQRTYLVCMGYSGKSIARTRQSSQR